MTCQCFLFDVSSVSFFSKSGNSRGKRIKYCLIMIIIINTKKITKKMLNDNHYYFH